MAQYRLAEKTLINVYEMQNSLVIAHIVNE